MGLGLASGAARRSIVSGTMGVRIGTGLSTVPDPRIAALEAASAAAVELAGATCELAVVFVSGNPRQRPRRCSPPSTRSSPRTA